METLTEKYPPHFKHKAPQINLPFSKTYGLIFSYYNINNLQNFNIEFDPRRIAECKYCSEKIDIIRGSSLYSSYTFSLTCHLKKHPEKWLDYLDSIAHKMIPDTKSVYEHFQRMDAQTKVSSEEASSLRVREGHRNRNLNPKNSAGVFYSKRDYYYQQTTNRELVESDNARLFQYIHKFTTQNLRLIELMGQNHSSADLRMKANRKKSKCLVDNDGNFTLDLEQLLCVNMCFLDPELYGYCPKKHNGNISTFNNEAFQKDSLGFKDEIEKYPEFQSNKKFDDILLKNVKNIEEDSAAIVEMNRLLKIIISLIIVQKNQIEVKIKQLISKATDENNLVKPPLAIHLWGPKYHDVDTSEDQGQLYPESMYSTFSHTKKEDCPAFKENSKQIYHEPFVKHDKVFYPCNVGGCCKGCNCSPCNNVEESFKCPEHHPGHTLLFDPTEDFKLPRRILFDVQSKQAIFRRQYKDPKICLPSLKLTGIKRKCRVCRRIVKDHILNHHSLHTSVCEICEHLDFISKNSFALICYVCMKRFESKYRLEDHLNIHNENNPFVCKSCEKCFTTKSHYERHVMENHEENQKVYACNECAATFTLERNLNRHRVDVHTTESNEYKCDLCDKSFKRRDSLLKHHRCKHNFNSRKAVLPGATVDENNFECHICKKIFAQKKSLDRHLKTVHSNTLIHEYKCNSCGNMFNRKDELQRHEKVHKSENKIICEVCLMQFKSKIELKAHRVTKHEGNN